jgi:hypothetical protein
MSRRFTDAQALLAHLLDRHEAGTASPIGYPDYPAFVSVVATDAFIRELQQAEQAGAVSIACGKGRTTALGTTNVNEVRIVWGRKSLANQVK